MNKCETCTHWFHNDVELVCTKCGTPKELEAKPNALDTFTKEENRKFLTRLQTEDEEKRYLAWKSAQGIQEPDENLRVKNQGSFHKQRTVKIDGLLILGLFMILVSITLAVFAFLEFSKSRQVNVVPKTESAAYSLGYDGNRGIGLAYVLNAGSRNSYCRANLGLHPGFTSVERNDYVKGCKQVLEDMYGPE